MKTFLPLLLPLLIVLGGCSKAPVVETESEGQQQQEVKEEVQPEKPVAQAKPVKAAPVNPIKYKIAGDTVTITGCDRKASGALTIPATIEGKPVTSIGDKAFAYCSGLTSITIPDSVTSIGVRAFYKCSSLTSTTIPDGVTSIRDFAFLGCTSLTDILIPDGVTSIGKSAFSDCTSLTNIAIPHGVTSIGWSAFARYTSLMSVTIPASVTSLGDYAFVVCRSLTAVTFLGDAPKEQPHHDVFAGATSTIYRKPEAKGWGETWAGRPVKLISEKP
ncbi:MAG: leucine-rich repeat domain-containing protein [Verrucomicrobiales bacterium]